ncbi:hypothetical protein KITKAT_45 [Arthrobacter phage Kitkat]|uniref:Uncharacterized protein n=3 Tax=Kelleziovirus TaxID=1982236 RepID=A0A140G6C8_9CAUD|nr:hypothetical protein BJD78_gp43 [Arthrobacter phage KellEzio]YP_009303328.1 hypothetical protein BJD77_gp045 [Arthrobacter phage Kitkat]AMM44213.1 hypothetical protein KELLEZIO_43 [Arthrobacter phage KellEzio]AMM44307.1 hypothetical protein KITKAT_45 [Arthrobacter phage Kitkat]QGJ96483.1 hypothetical protein SEA_BEATUSCOMEDENTI_44 [Arthrobacter phage BeatusComedenti]
MQQAETTRFQRVDGTFGETVEYSTKTGNILAYVDYSKDGASASCTVFTPWKGTSRYYGPRPAAKAEGIVKRHLTTENYSTGEGE